MQPCDVLKALSLECCVEIDSFVDFKVRKNHFDFPV